MHKNTNPKWSDVHWQSADDFVAQQSRNDADSRARLGRYRVEHSSPSAAKHKHVSKDDAS